MKSQASTDSALVICIYVQVGRIVRPNLLPIAVINRFFMKMFNTNDMHTARNCQMYFNFDMPSTLWAKRVRNFNVKFSASNNMFCKATELLAHLT